jgi:radical SAM superfamily enzyme YgiQ (UPF0313 family)
MIEVVFPKGKPEIFMGVLKKKVIMFQLPFLEFKSIKSWSNSPWGAAMLKASAHRAGLADSFDIEILPATLVNNGGDAWIIDSLEARNPDIICATLYLWNSLRTLHIAGQLKKRLPKLLFIVGGPEVVADSSYIIDNTIVDFGCIGEGEEVFAAILRAIADGTDPQPTPGLFWKKGGRTVLSPGRGCIEDIDLIPSPLQMGIMKPLNEEIVSYETMRGCPCSCSYCITGAIPWRNFSADRVVKDLSLLYGYGVKKIRLCCSNFLLHPEFFDICDRLSRINADRRMAVACFSYAEHVTPEKAEALKSCNVCFVEIGLQSVNPETLRAVRRPPFNEARFLEGVGHLRNAGIDFSIDMIAGLPGESPWDIDRSIAFLKDNRIRQYNLFPLQLLPGSPLRSDASRLGIEADNLPPYTVSRTRSMTREQIQSFSRKTEIDPVDICFDLAQEFRLPGFAILNVSDFASTAVSPAVTLINKILVSGEVDLKHLAEEGTGRIAGTVIMIFSNLERSLASFAGVVEAVWSKNPFCLIMPVFEIGTDAKLDNVRQLCRGYSEQNLVRKTIVKDPRLHLEADDMPGFTHFDRLHMGSADDSARVAACGAPNILADLPSLLDAAQLRRTMALIVGTGKNIQYRNLAFHYLDHLVRQEQAGRAGVIHAPVDMGSIVVVDAVGRINPSFSMNRRSAVEIAHMQLLFMRFIRGAGEGTVERSRSCTCL